jgi:exodeoxyribonuclease-3
MKKQSADFYCFQEIKSDKQTQFGDYIDYWSLAEKKGYSGVGVYAKDKALSVVKGIGVERFDKEGRVLTLEYQKFFLVNAYFPHSNRQLSRLKYKLGFDKNFLKYCRKLDKKKPVIIASDFNVAHQEIDLANPKQNVKNAGFTIEEREWFDKFLKNGFVDTFRIFTKSGGHYTWWTWRSNCRERNIGWRVDYFIVSKRLKNKVKTSKILSKVFGSDHAPILLEIKL